MFYDRKAQSGSADIACSRAIDAVKAFEYAAELFGHNSFTGIRDLNDGTFRPFFERNTDQAATDVEFNGIVHEVGYHLFKPALIGKHTRVRRCIIYQRDVAFGSL